MLKFLDQLIKELTALHKELARLNDNLEVIFRISR